MSEALKIGTIRKNSDGSHLGTLQHIYPGHDRAAVWKMLTDSSCFNQWLAPGTIEARVGGRAKISFEDSGVAVDSEVKEYTVNTALAYSWSSGNEPERMLRFTLADAKDGTQLTLTVNSPAGEDIVKACAGFEAHLEMLGAALEGISIKFPFALYKQAREEYSKLLSE